MSRAATKVELTRWHPPRHDFWLAIAVKKRKHRPSPTGFMWKAEMDCARTWVCGSWGKPHERTAALECLNEFRRRFDRRFSIAGFAQVDEGLWFAFYRFERALGL